MLMTLITLSVLLVTVSITTVGGRLDNGRALQSTQAVLAADSGVSSFVARVKEGGFVGQLSTLACWVQGSEVGGGGCVSGTTGNLGTLYLTSSASGPRADVKVVQLNTSDSTITIQSVGRTGPSGNEAKATLTQRVTYSRPTFMNTSPPAALTSCPSISAGGSSNLTGSATAYSGIVPDFTTVISASPSTVSVAMASGILSGSGWPTTITVADATNLSTGSVIQLGTQTYRITSQPSANALTIVPANSLSLPPVGTSLVGTLNLIPIAVRTTSFATGSTTGGKLIYRLPIGDPTSIYINDVLYVTLSGVTYGLTVAGKGFVDGDLTQGYVDVTLGASGAGANTYNPVTGALLLANAIPTPTALQLSSAVWARRCAATCRRPSVPTRLPGSPAAWCPSSAWGGSSTQSPAAIAGSSNVSCGDALFAQMFNNYTKTQYYNLVPTANRLGSSTRR